MNGYVCANAHRSTFYAQMRIEYHVCAFAHRYAESMKRSSQTWTQHDGVTFSADAFGDDEPEIHCMTLIDVSLANDTDGMVVCHVATSGRLGSC